MPTRAADPHQPLVKVVCTLGPATGTAAALREMVDAGMDVARLNFSHGTHDEHGARIALVRAAAEAAGRPVAVLADLQGPKLRLGAFAGGRAVLETGAEFTITTEPVTGDPRLASTTYAALARDVKPGDAVLVDDGNVRLEVLDADGTRVRCRVVEGGTVSDHKGLNLPGVAVSAPAFGDKDRADLAFALAAGVDAVALSFVRSPGDAVVVRDAMARAGRIVPLHAKIEKPEAVERLEAIVEAFDGLMVARGDLGVEMPLEHVPLVQKRAIRLARAAAKPVIVATQMLESMVTHSRPTRAEASDVANAVLDGADALMLSAETSVGAHAVDAVRTMRRIAAAAAPALVVDREGGGDGVSRTVARAAVATAIAVGARALVAITRSGATARQSASHRAPVPLLALTPDADVVRRLAFTWGVAPRRLEDAPGREGLGALIDAAVRESGVAAAGDLVVIVSGSRHGEAGATNQMRMHVVGT